MPHKALVLHGRRGGPGDPGLLHAVVRQFENHNRDDFERSGLQAIVEILLNLCWELRELLPTLRYNTSLQW